MLRETKASMMKITSFRTGIMVLHCYTSMQFQFLYGNTPQYLLSRKTFFLPSIQCLNDGLISFVVYYLGYGIFFKKRKSKLNNIFSTSTKSANSVLTASRIEGGVFLGRRAAFFNFSARPFGSRWTILTLSDRVG